jgi:malonate-semialdehyde dehydrogenase (acetylating)/methylmalonate-semialdehyde dehydrogenase
MLEHENIKGIKFVGSTPTARDVIYPGCGKYGRRVIAQGGAANFIVVMPDCNVRATIPALMTSFFGNAGQRCLAGQTLIIADNGNHNNFYKDFMEAVTATSKGIILGNGLDESVQMGPLRDAQKKERILGIIENAIKDGVKLRLEGKKPRKILGNYPHICFLGPTIFEDVTPEMQCVTEEIFGPTMGVMRVKALDEAIEICNKNPFHNADAIFTSSGKNARKF